jgi:lipid-binding SYLF domain-containing protein
MRGIFFLLYSLASAAPLAFAADTGAASPATPNRTSARLASATQAFQEILRIPEGSIPQDLLNRARCVIIIPGVKQGAFLFGARYGRGFLSCRNPDGIGWTAPGAVRLEGATFGLQIGGEETDIVALVLNERGRDRLLSTRFTLGGSAGGAVGPYGRTVRAETDAALTAEILTWARSRGVFGGIALSGATLREDSTALTELYGRSGLTNREIITGSFPVPDAAQPLLTELNRFSSRR